MARYLYERVLSALLTMFFITAILYVLLASIQGSALDVMGGSGGETAAEYESARQALGLDLPLWLRYAHWLRDVLRGDLGMSYRYGIPVAEVIGQRFWPSVLLIGTGVSFAVLLGVPVGLLAAYRPRSVWDSLSSFFALTGFAVPRFITCIAFIYIFSFKLRLVPATGMHSSGVVSFGDLVSLLYRGNLNLLTTLAFIHRFTRTPVNRLLQVAFTHTGLHTTRQPVRILRCTHQHGRTGPGIPVFFTKQPSQFHAQGIECITIRLHISFLVSQRIQQLLYLSTITALQV